MELSTPADLLALIPTLMNREPKEILVLVCVKDNKVQAVLGLEHLRDDEDMAEYVAGIVAEMTQLKPEALAPVFYTERDGHEPFRHVNMLIMLALDFLTPMVVNPGILVTGGRYHVYGSDVWHDISDVKDSALAANMVLHGIPLQPEGIAIPEPTAVTEDVSDAIDERVARISVYRPDIRSTWRLPHVRKERALYEELLQRGFGATEEEAVRMIACFQIPLMRDRLMVDTVSDTMDPEEFGDLVTGQCDIQVNPDRIMAAVHLTDNLMQWANDRHRLPLLLMQAWLHWMQGRTLDADQYLDAATALDPEYRMAKAFRRYIKEVKRIPDSVTHREAL